MTIHVPVSEAEIRLKELVSAAVRGEDIVLDEGGAPQVRLVGLASKEAPQIERRGMKRRAAIGMFKHLVDDRDIVISALRADDRWDEHYRRKFADPD